MTAQQALSSVQLEIICPDGEIEFYDLDPISGVANIGRHPDNDIVLAGSGVALYHATLDYHQMPFRITLLAESGQMMLKGHPVPANIPIEVDSWDSVEVDGYTLVLVETGAAPERAGPIPMQRFPQVEAELRSWPVAIEPVLSDQRSEFIVTEMPDREWTVDVGQTITAQVTVINGGSIVATFEVGMEGLDPNWVVVSPPQVYLNEGGRETVMISITPPRLSTTRAGTHRLAVVVTSPNYSGHASRTVATLRVNPYLEFSVGEPSPRVQTVTWSRRYGQATMPIANKGNSETGFIVEGEDEERACRFEFKVPGEQVALLRQAEVRVPAGETALIPVRITPPHRLVAIRKRTHSFTITTTMVGGEQIPRLVMGQLRSAPLFGPLPVALAALVLAILIVAVFRPRIAAFNVKPAQVTAGTPVVLSWEVSGLAKPQLNQGIGVAGGPQGEVTAVPTGDVTYRLEADNWLARLSPRWFAATREAAVVVTAPKPVIRLLWVNRPEIVSGETVVLKWEVENADELTLYTNDNEETLSSAEHVGERTLQLSEKTIFKLSAPYPGGEPVVKSVEVKVTVPPTPSPTPLALPVIESFTVVPLEIVQGGSVSIEWQVTGAQSVAISPSPGEVPAGGSVIDSPGSTTTYILRASNGQPGGEVRLLHTVIVHAPTPTPPTPAPPQIDLRVWAKNPILGVPSTLTLQWSVSGKTTNIVIGGPDFGPYAGQPKTAQKDFSYVPTQENLEFYVTAYNGDVAQSKTATLKVGRPTPTPAPTLPPPSISTFQVKAAEPEDYYKVQVKEGTNGRGFVVVAGTRVVLFWVVRNASSVELRLNDTTIASGLKGEDQMAVIAGSRKDTYMITAFVGDNARGSLSVTIEPKPLNIPVPTNVRGVEESGSVTIMWDYDIDFTDLISGFRVFRADLPQDFKLVASEHDGLGNTAFEWRDTSGSTCGKAYYVVAVYTDLEGQKKTTDASTTSFYTKPCPPAP